MVRVKDLLAHLDKLAPLSMKLDFDNVGHLVGRGEAEVRRVLVALDITDAVIAEAVDLGAELIVSHHPLLRDPLRGVTDSDQIGRKVLTLAERGIAAICMHTNLDAATGGVNDVLAAALGLSETEILWQTGALDGVPYGMGRVGALPSPLAMADFLPRVKTSLCASGLRYHDAGRPVQRVAVMGGSGSDALSLALAAGCDTYVTGEVKYSSFLEAKEQGLNLIEADHYCTENVISAPLREAIAEAFPELCVTVSARQEQTARFFVG